MINGVNMTQLSDREKMRCFHHESNKKLRKKGFITGACVINWDIPCGGTPNSVPYPHRCKGYYVPIYKIDEIRR